MRQHKLALCREHFRKWIPQQTQRFIELYGMFNHDERILIAVSGGKDSLALWDVLQQLGYQADGLYIGLGIDGSLSYSAQSLEFCQTFAAARDLKLIVHDVNEHEGANIPEAARMTHRGREKPCSLCGLTKRHVMNRIAFERGYDVLATGHNLDDEAAVLMGNTMQWQVGYLQRQGPVLTARPGFARKVKPFFRFYERETAAYAFLQGIEYIYHECPYAEGATSIYYKKILNQMEFERPGTKLSFYLAYLRAKETITFEDPAQHPQELVACIQCGQLTTAAEFCAFCRTWEQVRVRLASSSPS
jgi:uncharacterized protein (TIGR00269 family)